MAPLKNASVMKELSPLGHQFNYIFSDGRVYASIASWSRGLQVPGRMKQWFENRVAICASLLKDQAGGMHEATFEGHAVYRWHVVAEALHVFDRMWHMGSFRSRPLDEQQELEVFHQKYDRLRRWGIELQEKALSALLNRAVGADTPKTEQGLTSVLAKVVEPKLATHQRELDAHAKQITFIKESIPALAEPTEFITVKQGLLELGLDSDVMPMYPVRRENLAGCVGQELKRRRIDVGGRVVERLDGAKMETYVNTYPRAQVHAVARDVVNAAKGRLQPKSGADDDSQLSLLS